MPDELRPIGAMFFYVFKDETSTGPPVKITYRVKAHVKVLISGTEEWAEAIEPVKVEDA